MASRIVPITARQRAALAELLQRAADARLALTSYASAVVGGGAVVTPVFYDGTNWVAD